MSQPISRQPLSRRTLIARFGPAALMVGPLLRSSRLLAAPPRRRFLTFFVGSGVLQEGFWPKGSYGNFSEGKYSVDGVSLEPLKPHLNDVIIPKGVTLDRGPGDSHDSGTVGAVTGNYMNSGTESLDRIIANRISADTRERYLNLGVRVRCARPSKWISYDAKGSPVEPNQDPYVTYDRIFRALVGSCTGMPGGTPAAPSPELERLRMRRRSVLDTVLGEVAGLKKAQGLTAEERQKLEKMEESIRTVEKRLDTVAPVARTVQCGNARNVFESPTKISDSGGNYPKILGLQLDLIALAFELDATRVASIILDQGGSCGDTMSWLSYNGQPLDGSHHNITHGIDPKIGTNVADYQAKEAVVDRWIFQQFADLIGRLKGISDGPGTVLDNSLLWYATDSGSGNRHDKANAPFIVAGRGGGSLRTGRYIDCGGANHQRLLVSFCQALGLEDIQRVGRPEASVGGPLL